MVRRRALPIPPARLSKVIRLRISLLWIQIALKRNSSSAFPKEAIWPLRLRASSGSRLVLTMLSRLPAAGRHFASPCGEKGGLLQISFSSACMRIMQAGNIRTDVNDA